MIDHIPVHYNNRHDMPAPDNFLISFDECLGRLPVTNIVKLENIINPKTEHKETVLDGLKEINNNRIQKGLEDESEYLPL